MKRLTRFLFLCAVLVLGCIGKVWAGDYSNNAQLTANANPTGKGTVYVTLAERDDEGNWTGKHGENVLSSYKATSASGKKDLGSGVTGYFSAYAHPKRGYAFSHWSDLTGNGNPALAWSSNDKDNPVFVQVTAATSSNGSSNDATIKANFIENPIPAFPVKYEAPAQAGCTYTAVAAESDYGSITIDGTTEYTTWNTDYITLTATPATGWQFYRWVVKDENGIKETLGEAIVNPLLTTLPAHARTVTAEFITPANFIVGEATFMDFEPALQYAATAAGRGEKVTILQLKDYTIPAGYYTIPEGVTLLIPRNASQTRLEHHPTREYNVYTTPSCFRKLTLSEGVHLDVFGTIQTGGMQSAKGTVGSCYNGTPSNTYGMIVMGANSTMTIENGAQLYSWGYIIGEGTIDVRRGGVVHEFVQITDWRGGTCTNNMNGNQYKVFPINQYHIQNIEVATTYRPGSQLLCDGTVNAASNYRPFNDVHLVGIYGSESLFMMDNEDDSEDTWVRKKYDTKTDQQVYEVNSSAQLGSLVLELYGIPFNSSGYVLPITNNFKIRLLTGEMQITQNTELLSGSVLEVEKEATMVMNSGKNLYVFDQTDWGTFTHKVPYSPSWKSNPRPAMTDAQVNVHGTFRVEGGLYTTATGANIFSTNNDAGTILFVGAAPAQKTIYVNNTTKTATENYTSVTANPAWLQNGAGADPAYAETAGTAAGKSFCYMNDRWTLMDVDPDSACFVLDNYGVYYAKPGEYVAISATKDPETKVISGNADHTFSDYAGEGRLFILMDDCQWWEVEFENNRYHKKVEAGSDEAPKYYEYDEEQGKWVDYRYTITWKNYDDEVITTYKLTAGTEPKYLGTNPTRPEDIDYTYNFVGWTPALTTVTGDETYKANFDAVEKRYLIRFINENGGEIERHFLKRGEMPVCSDVPNKAGNYLVWSPTIAQVTGAQDYTATYLAEEPTEFTVTWKNFDGTEIYHETVDKDATPSYDEATYGTPVKTVGGSEYDYTFTGWSPTIAAVTGDVAYTAQFSQAKKTFAIRFLDENGTQIGEMQNVQVGAMPVIPACDKINSVDGHRYTLVWSPLVEAASKAQDYRATFTDEVNKYTVTLIGNGCSVTGSGTYTHGASVTISATANPGREFVKWSDENTDNPRTLTVTGPVNLSAVTNSVPMVVIDGEDKTIKSPTTVEDVVINASEETSGQLFGIENLNITGNVYFDYNFNGDAFNRANQNWYAFAVPFECDPKQLQYKKTDGTYANLVLDKDLDIVYYDAAIRAQYGTSKNAWAYVDDATTGVHADHMLHPGVLYLAAFARHYDVIRFKKTATSPLVADNMVAMTPHESQTGSDIDANWNGIANPALYYAKMQVGNVIVAQEYVYTEGESSYKTVELIDKTFSVGRPMFVQSASETAKAVKVSRPASAAPARARAAAQSDLVDIRISAEGADEYSDRVFVAIDDDKESDSYTIGADLAKAGVATKRAQMWVNNYASKLCLNTQAAVGSTVAYPLGIYVPADGEYIIDANANANIEGTLYLTLNGQVIWNLSMSEYSAWMNAGTNNAYGLRWVLGAPSITTDVEEIGAQEYDGAEKLLYNGQLFILRDGRVYDAQGKLVK